MARTEYAQAAAAIRKEMKALGIKGSVMSKGYAGGNSVSVIVSDPVSPELGEKFRKICAKYKRGHFDGMTDSYNYSNRREDIPQAMYVWVDFNHRLYAA